MSALVDGGADHTGELRRHWPAVLGCFATAVFAWGFGFSGTSVYLAELHQLHGWSRGVIGAAITTYYLGGAACMVLVNTALRRLGPRPLLATGTVLLGLGATLFSRSDHAWQLFGAAAVMALGWAGSTTTAIPIALARYFERQRGLAISLALNGASSAGFTVGPVLVVLSQAIGVRNAVPLNALALLTAVLPAIWFGFRGPPQSSIAPAPSDGILFINRRIPAAWRFWSLTLPFALALSAQVGFLVHLVSLLLPHIGADGAATGLAVTSIAAISGRLALAPVIDRLPQRLASALSFTTQAGALSLMLLLPDQAAPLYAGCIVFGLSVGNLITFPALLVQREYPPCLFGPVIGLNTAVCQFGFTLAPALLGIVRDVTGGYSAVLLMCIALELAAAIIILGGRPLRDMSTA